MGLDVTYHISKGHLYKDIENDGPTYMKYGPETISTCLCTVEEAKEQYPEIYERLVGQKNAICK